MYGLLTLLLLTGYIHSSTADADDDCECGIEKAQERVFRGQNLPKHKYPWLVWLRTYEEPNGWTSTSCGGSLIDDQHVITAAHCFYLNKVRVPYANLTEVYAGIHSVDSTVTPILAEEIHIHPEYEQSKLGNDIAIIRLSQKVTFNKHIFPICLPKDRSTPFKDGRMVVAGWGLTGPRARGSSVVPLEVEVDYIHRDDCYSRKQRYFMELGVANETNKHLVQKLSDLEICALNLDTFADTCKGDSGGPLMFLNPKNKRWYLIGLVSRGWGQAGCGEVDYTPGIYTSVLAHHKLIKGDTPNGCWRTYGSNKKGNSSK